MEGSTRGQGEQLRRGTGGKIELSGRPVLMRHMTTLMSAAGTRGERGTSLRQHYDSTSTTLVGQLTSAYHSPGLTTVIQVLEALFK